MQSPFPVPAPAHACTHFMAERKYDLHVTVEWVTEAEPGPEPWLLLVVWAPYTVTGIGSLMVCVDVLKVPIFLPVKQLFSFFLFKDDIFSGLQTKTTKPKSRSAQIAPEPRSEHKVSNIFDDPLNAFGGQ